MIFTLEALPAQEGDCLLLHWSNGQNNHLAVIDGGPGRVYENALKPRLLEIRDNKSVDNLNLEIVMVSHVDNDHVVGIKKLFKDIRSDIEDGTPVAERPFRTRRLWHNTFNDILGDSIDKYYREFTASFTASTNGEPNPVVLQKLRDELRSRGQTQDQAEHNAYDIGLILAGHGEGRELRDSHKFLFDSGEISALNSPFKKNGKPTLITADMTPAPETVAGLKFRIVGPQEDQIAALQEDFDQFIDARGLTAEAVLAAYADDSIRNLSSIVCLAEANGKTILLTGDARGDYVLEGLEGAGLLNGGKLKVDILKVPHHGSDRNLEEDFFDTIEADTYVISANGKHGNPDRASIEWLISSRAKNDRYTIVLTYPVDKIDAKRKAEASSWNRNRDSLEVLFEERANDGFRFRVLAEEGAKVELGDPIAW